MPRPDVQSSFIELPEITRVVPCLADPDKIRFSASFKRDVSGIFPYLNAILQGAIYNHAGKTLTIRKDGRLVTLHPDHVAAAKIDGVEDAREVIAWLVGLINECDQKRATIKPNYERRERLNVIDVVRLLPGTHCKKCDQPTCLSFAAKLAAEKTSILSCAEIFAPEYREKRVELIRLLRAGGYTVPDVFQR